MSGFSFSGNISRNLLVHISEIIPGLERVIGIFDSDITKESEIRYTLKLDGKTHTHLFEGNIDLKSINSLRNKRSGFEWIKPGDEPFKNRSQIDFEPELFEEADKTILCLRVKHDQDKELSDIFYLYFNKELTNLGVKKSNSFLNTDSKQLIRTLLELEIKQVIRMWRNDKKVASNYNNMVKQTIDDYKTKLKSSKNQIVDFAISCINEINSNSEVQYVLTDLAFDKLKNYNGPVDKLNELIIKSVEFALLTNPDNLIISIDESLLRLNYISEDKANIKNQAKIFIKYADVAAYLDNFENAIKQIIDEGLEVKSSNVGERLKPRPVKSAAISLSLKKRSNKIIYLMKNHRDRWPLLRKYFKPMRNILRNEHDLIVEVS